MTVPRFHLNDHELLRTLMRRTGDGSRTSVRDLAGYAGVHASFIGRLIAGEQETVTAEVAAAISRRIGVDLLILWTPIERTASAVAASTASEEVAA